jgi:hypothetical protein
MHSVGYRGDVYATLIGAGQGDRDVHVITVSQKMIGCESIIAPFHCIYILNWKPCRRWG